MGHQPEVAPFLYAGYLVWVFAGLADFLFHRRSNLPRTSGLRESRFHLIQIGLIGGGVLGWLALSPNWGMWSLLALLAVVHALIGYLDTRSAYGLREITPAEQHVHSVLDIAPWIALGILAWDLATDGASRPAGLGLREEPLPLATWAAMMSPAGVLVILPAVAELVACRRTRYDGA